MASSSPSDSHLHLRHPPHTLLLPFPETGHINPLMQLARFLATNGCLITFVNTQHNHDRMFKSNAAHLPSDAGLPINLLPIPDGLADADDRDTDVANMFQVIHSNTMSALAALISDLNNRGPPVTCIISDVCSGETLQVAKRFGIPRVAFWPPNASTHYIFCHTVAASNHGSFPAKGVPESNDTVVQFPGLPALQGLQLPWIVGSREQSEVIFEGMKRNVEALHESEWVLCNSVEELETAMAETVPDGFPKLCTVGPLFLPLNEASEVDVKKIKTWLWEEEEMCLEWLDAKEERSVLYVSLGSITTMSGRQMIEMVHGLQESGVDILWVLRQGTVSPAPVMNNKEEEEEEDGGREAWTEVFVEELRRRNNGVDRSSKMMIANWVPQVSVLSHKAIAGFLTHTGWNSSIEAMAMGVPMLCWPHLVDQFLNTQLLVLKWGVGMPLLPPPHAAAASGVDASHGHHRPLLLDRATIKTRVAHFMALCSRDSPSSNSHVSSTSASALSSPASASLLFNSSHIRQTILRASRPGGSSHSNLHRFLDWLTIL